VDAQGILLLVAITFISWGGYSLIREKNQSYAAKVNGITIDWKVYDDAYQNAIRQYRDAFGASFRKR